MYQQNRNLIRGHQGKICYLGPKHPAIGPYNPIVFPWQESYHDLSFWQSSPYQSALVDTLSVTFKPDYINKLTPAEVAARIVSQTVYNLGITIGESVNPRNFYNYTYTLVDAKEVGIKVGYIAFGGNRDSAQVYLDATGCSVLTSWHAFHQRLVDLRANLTRIDLAYDDFEGNYTVDTARKMYDLGRFNTGGRQPAFRFIDEGNGQTFYVGKRQGGKMLRVYEKGKQLGVMDSPWVRWEVEYLSKNRKLPLDMMLKPGRYLAGAYPSALQFISGEMCYIKTQNAVAKTIYQSLIKNIRRSYGKLVNVMLHIEGSAERVIELIRPDDGTQVPKRLIFPSLVASPVSNTGLKYQDTPF